MLSMSAGGVQSVLLMSGKSRWQLLNKLSSLVGRGPELHPGSRVGLYGAVTAWSRSCSSIRSWPAIRCPAWWVSAPRGVRWPPSPVLGAAVPTACALVALLLLGQSVLGVIVYVVLVPVYGGVLFRFRKALGIERFLSARRAKSAAS